MYMCMGPSPADCAFFSPIQAVEDQPANVPRRGPSCCAVMHVPFNMKYLQCGTISSLHSMPLSGLSVRSMKKWYVSCTCITTLLERSCWVQQGTTARSARQGEWFFSQQA